MAAGVARTLRVAQSVLCLLLSSQLFAADIEQRFRDEYPDAAKRLEQLYGSCRIHGVKVSRNNRREIVYAFDYLRDGEQVRSVVTVAQAPAGHVAGESTALLL